MSRSAKIIAPAQSSLASSITSAKGKKPTQPPMLKKGMAMPSEDEIIIDNARDGKIVEATHIFSPLYAPLKDMIDSGKSILLEIV